MAKNTENTAFFTIITVTFNNLEGLKRTHASLKAQNSQNFEWIVVDGGSDDGSAEYLKSTDARWTSEADDGIYDAMNKGLERASATYVLFLNAGDELAAPYVLENIEYTAGENLDFIYGDSLETVPTGEPVYKPARKPDIRAGMFTHHQAMLYKREGLKDIRYDLRYTIAADYDFTARFLSGEKEILECSFPICLFESGGISQTKSAWGRREQYQIRKDLKLTGSLQNVVITYAQALLWTLRTIAPSLYWNMKSSGNSAPVCPQNDSPPGHPKTPA